MTTKKRKFSEPTDKSVVQVSERLRSQSKQIKFRTTFIVGDKVESKWTDGRWYTGWVYEVNKTGNVATFGILFLDGVKSPRVKLTNIRYVVKKETLDEFHGEDLEKALKKANDNMSKQNKEKKKPTPKKRIGKNEDSIDDSENEDYSSTGEDESDNCKIMIRTEPLKRPTVAETKIAKENHINGKLSENHKKRKDIDNQFTKDSNIIQLIYPTPNLISELEWKSSKLICGTMRFTTWGKSNLSVDQMEELMIHCIQKGITCFDVADIYGHNDQLSLQNARDQYVEQLIGGVLKKNPTLRNKITIITKCGVILPSEKIKIHQYNSSYEHILNTVSNSLQKLNLDYIDLLLIHRHDYLGNPQEIATAFKKLKDENKVIHFGVSNYLPSQISVLRKHLNIFQIPLVVNQIQFSPSHLFPLENGTFDYMLKHNIKPQIYSPFDGGRIFDENSQEPQIVRLREIIRNIALNLNTNMESVILAWIMKHPAQPDIIFGTSLIERIDSMLPSLTLQLSREDWYNILEASKGCRVL